MRNGHRGAVVEDGTIVSNARTTIVDRAARPGSVLPRPARQRRARVPRLAARTTDAPETGAPERAA